MDTVFLKFSAKFNLLFVIISGRNYEYMNIIQDNF